MATAIVTNDEITVSMQRRRPYIAGTVAAGETQELEVASWMLPIVVTVLPGAGGTVTVSTSTTRSGTPNYIAWGTGASGTDAREAFTYPITFIKIAAATEEGAYEIIGSGHD